MKQNLDLFVKRIRFYFNIYILKIEAYLLFLRIKENANVNDETIYVLEDENLIYFFLFF